MLVYLFRVPMSPDVKPVVVHLVEHKIWILYACFVVVFFFKYILGIQIVDILLNNSFTQYLEGLPSYGTPAPASSPSGFWSTLRADMGLGTPAPAQGTPAQGTPAHAAPAPAPAPAPAQGTPTQAQLSSAYASSLQNSLSNALSTSTISSSVVLPSSSPSPGYATSKQVFNVGNNNYTFDEAQQVCSAFGAQLATYDQVESAYNNGGEWCNYGWSDGQMAFFPTQKSTWDRLQQNEGTKNACGRPGINGGYIANPRVRFGANCYGVKPVEPVGWQPTAIGVNSSSACNVNTEDPKLTALKKAAKISGFNNDQWSKY
jgi:hypothetical protein